MACEALRGGGVIVVETPISIKDSPEWVSAWIDLGIILFEPALLVYLAVTLVGRFGITM